MTFIQIVSFVRVIGHVQAVNVVYLSLGQLNIAIKHAQITRNNSNNFAWVYNSVDEQQLEVFDIVFESCILQNNRHLRCML